ncbi:hypothetical protein M430DRAFT_65660 [Amorphotheca resinae ATCC 22711]|uniref:Glutathione synthetase n=1 Tax=Amorphotheca resinae ATCC 22711 TaxID=857342 RepID=A0A2T3B6X8_AMORE|nr:hypothetical protein M430DRAFT_65660 [Amorphotheca resinae ATCC 22711]PSS22501.1 hypothetical protein M430DRAFT_65660 [Amorphotheca resinae ATCC 22711]
MASQRTPEGSYPPDLTAAESENLVFTIKDWSIAHGLAVRPPPALVAAEADPHGVLATTAPVTLFPSPFPRVCFEQARSIQKAYNQLYAAIAQDEEFLGEIVQEILEVDEFIAELWQVHLKVKEEGYVQNLSLGLFRSDYMVHQGDTDAGPTIKQVEFNTIASSFGGLSAQTSNLHKHLSISDYPLLEKPILTSALDLPENTSTQSLAAGLRFAFDTYIKSGPSHDCCIIFLVQDPERNIFDQRHLEYELKQHTSPIPVFRLPFAQILSHTSIADTPKRQLLYHLPSNPSKTYEVAVVYFRAGYGPQDYPDASAWKARLQIERSNAIKCPTILTQLAGAKKVQQVLATPKAPSEPSILGRFMGTTSGLEDLENTFTNIFPLDDSPAGLEARKIAVDPERCKGYVLKPQREGGGNNIYRSAIPPFLKSLPETHWKSYILMEIITPPPVHNMILRNGVVEKGGVICELGIYGTCVWDGTTKQLLHNEGAGYLLRTKGDQSEEGGVAAGFGSMDSCRLV